MEKFDYQKKEHVLSFISRYLVRNGLYKTALKLQKEANLGTKQSKNKFSSKKLEKMMGFYYEAWRQRQELQEGQNPSVEIQQENKSVYEEDQSEQSEKNEEGTQEQLNSEAKAEEEEEESDLELDLVDENQSAKSQESHHFQTGSNNQQSNEDCQPSTNPKSNGKCLKSASSQDKDTPKPKASIGFKIAKKITKKEKLKKLQDKRNKKMSNYKQFNKEISLVNHKVNRDYKQKVHHNGSFSRCSNVKSVRKELFDTSWQTKIRLGQDKFGELGYERLGGTRGKNFRKQKNKLKKRQLQGSKISFANNLIDLD